ncbi:MAG TPA: hypothetical protein VGL19_22230 [Polyangiaceae bacterium]
MTVLNGEKRLWLGLVWLIWACTGCADARGRFNDFHNRLAAVDAGMDNEPGDGGPCTPPKPGTVSGPALLAVDISLAEGKPILFLGTIDTPAFDGTTAVHFVYHALDSLDRSTLVGAELAVGPFALHDGSLTAPIPESTLDGDADPVLHGVPITSEMTLSGQICGVRPFYCGTSVGSTSGAVSANFTGRFGITLLDGPSAVPARPRYGCGDDDLAQPL